MKNRGFTLIELIVALGLFAIIVTLVSGAYLVMISVTRQAQGTATGINNLSFALETMTRTIRTGTNYSCNGGDCNGGTSFSVIRPGATIPTTYQLSGGAITQDDVPLTDPSVSISSLRFYLTGSNAGDGSQPHVTIIASGSVSSGHGKSESFVVETGATMRGIDL